MLFDPEAGKTSEEIIEIVLRRSPDLRAGLEEMAKVRGLSMHEFAHALVQEARAAHAAQMKDPATRAAYHATMDRKETPFGPDPLVRKDRCAMARSTKGLYKRGHVWWMTYCDAIGTQRFESCKTSNKKDAEHRLVDRRKEAQEGLLPDAPIKPLSLDELQQRYLDFVGHQRGVSTKQIHFAHFTRVWGNPPIHMLTVEVLDQFRGHRRGEWVGAATINLEMATLKHALSKAVEWKLLRKTAREELTAIKKYQEPDGRLRYLSGEAEAERLLQACGESLRPIVVTALHTGMRKGELLGLTWDLVDMTHGFIRLKQTKNGKARALPFNETLWSLFSGLRTRQDVPWVFHDAEGRRYNDIRHPFDGACEGAGLTDFHFHDLRHTFASWLMMRGVPLATVSNLLGHTSPTMTLRYAHLSHKHLTSAVSVLDPVSDSFSPVKVPAVQFPPCKPLQNCS